jgi:hypothetical protein
VTVYPVGNPACPVGPGCAPSPWRGTPLFGGSASDWDGDGCDDSDELWQNKPGVPTKCGDDPWNPNDLGPAATNVSGSYDLTAIAIRQDCDPTLEGDPTLCDPGTATSVPAGDHLPGFYYDCKADIQQNGKALTANVLCYIDSPALTVNPQAAKDNNGMSTNPKNCGLLATQAPAKYCGDGISGAPPPGITVGTKLGAPGGQALFADVDTKQTVLTGTLDNGQNVIKLAGCFEDVDGFGGLGNVYVEAVINAHTGPGQVNIQIAVTTAGSTRCLSVAPLKSQAQCPLSTTEGTGLSLKARPHSARSERVPIQILASTLARIRGTQLAPWPTLHRAHT